MNQNDQNQAQNQPRQQVSFWKSKDPAIVLVRILLIIFFGLPLLAIIGVIVLLVLSSLG